MRIYLDACCINRPFDDLSIDRNRLEAEAVQIVLRHVQSGTWEMAGSEALDAELSLIPTPDRRRAASVLAAMRSQVVTVGEAEHSRATALIGLGFKAMDALHIACAETARCDVLLTTDDRLLSRSRAYHSQIRIRLANPLDWIAEVLQP
jgi:predicted nucleic acid-binding protein